MDQLSLVVFVVALVSYLMMRQIGFVAGKTAPDITSFDKYAKFSVIIQNHIRAIKLDIDSSKNIEEPRYVLIDSEKEEDYIDLLSDFLRKLVFFETLLAKKKSDTEVESELFGVLSQLDEFLKLNCKDGEVLAEELKDNLMNQYEG